MEEEDGMFGLSESTFLALQEFIQDQATQDQTKIKENWQLSQFWYDSDTICRLSKATICQCFIDSKIALISCPSLYKKIKSLGEEEKKNIEVKLFEFDNRFSCFAPDFIFYDYNQPLNVESRYRNYFDIIVLDPPFLSEECLSKTSETVKFLGKAGSKILLCTGAVMEKLAEKLLGVKKCSFEPEHENNLCNDFISLTNFGEI